MDGDVRGSGFSRAEGSGTLPPHGDSGAVARPRLISALEAGFEFPGSFVMVSAPAGYGKSYLLSEWARNSRGRGVVTAWHGLTTDDRDPIVLWSSIVDAIAKSLGDPDAGSSASALLTELDVLRPDLSPSGHAAFVSALRSALERYERRLAIIVDDAHLINGSASEAEFMQVIQTLPPNVLLAFATRTPLQAHAARVAGRLRELTADSLSFTRAETTELLALRGFEDSDVEQLYAAADGWPAVLSLALLNVEREPGANALLIGDWSDPSILYDYMEHEIFMDLSTEHREVLLTIGIAPIMTADLANAITGTENSAQILRSLATQSQVVRRISTDANGRTWYGAKPLFAQFLREKIRESGPDALRMMITRAAEWFVKFGDVFSALTVALDPPDGELVDRILRRRGYDLVADGHALRLLAMLPPSNGPALAGPFARLMTAYAAACIPRPDRATDLLTAIDVSGLNADDLMEWDWLRYLVNVQLALGAGKSVDTVQSSWPEDSLDRMPEPLRLAIGITRGLSEARGGSPGSAVRDLTAALAVAENEDDLSTMVLGTVGLATAAAGQCQFHLALEFCERSLELTSRSTTQNQQGSRAIAHTLAAWCSLELLDIAGARAHAVEAVESAARQPDNQLRLESRDAYNDAFFDSLPQRRRVAQEFTMSWPPGYLHGASASFVVSSMYAGLRMTAEIDERRWGEHVLDRARIFLGESADWQAAYALHLLRTGRDDSARSIVAPLLSTGEQFGVVASEVVALSVQAVLEDRSKNPYRAHSAVYRALELADTTGAYSRVLIADGSAIVRLILAGAGRFGSHEHVARRLLSHDGGATGSQFGALTEREREILRELTTLRTVDEIARDLLLSVNTVKTHMRGIYRKLDVTSRRQAVAEAERLGLL